ncbi:heterokaryon incompatibility protein-domain-containing protein [Xylogone sp. PMI_703]|nr:heterokaryon incompatibility protein-domain-containing protein [Xylogone sp. PMI_703]
MSKSESTWKDRARWTKRAQESLINTLSKAISVGPVRKVVLRALGTVEVSIQQYVCAACRNHPASKRSIPFTKTVEELNRGAKEDCMVCCIALNTLHQFQGDSFRSEDVTSVDISPYIDDISDDGFLLRIICGEEDQENAETRITEDASSEDISSNVSSSTGGRSPAYKTRTWRLPGWRQLQEWITGNGPDRSPLESSSEEKESSEDESDHDEEAFRDDTSGHDYNADSGSDSSSSFGHGSILIETYQPEGNEILISGYQMSRNIDTNPLSNACVKIFEDWIRNCRTSHPNCLPPQEMKLPSRLVDMGERQSSHLKIINVHGLPLLSKKERLKYAALTHCWGGYISQSTTTANVKEREARLLEEDLPPSFRDAVRVARALNIRYIWIDSLCILQDDKNDWASEAMKMADVYKGSYIVISAARSPGSTTGFLGPGMPCKTVLSRRIDGKQLLVNARPWSNHGASGRVGPVQAEKCAMFTRAWCYQERLLATRVLYFTPTEVAFECMTSQWCECGIFDQDHGDDDPVHRPLWRIRGSRTPLSDTDFLELWSTVVDAYSQFNLTKDTDRLPALGGIARILETPKVHPGRYYAGLWERCFIQQLTWHPRHPTSRPKEYIAPTFSWASVVGQIIYSSMWELSRKGVTYCRLINGECRLDTADTFGMLREGTSITLQGTLHKLDITKLEPRRRGRYYKYPAKSRRHMEFVLDLKDDLDHTELLATLYFFGLGKWSRREYALVLRQTETKGEFKRVGISNSSSPPRNWFAIQEDGQPTVGEKITIV